MAQVVHLLFRRQIAYVIIFNFPGNLGSRFLSSRVDLVSAVFFCVYTKVRLLMLGIFNMCTDVNACYSTQSCIKTVHESALHVVPGRKIPYTGKLKLPKQLSQPDPHQYIPTQCNCKIHAQHKNFMWCLH